MRKEFAPNFTRDSHSFAFSIGSSDCSISVSGDENLEPDIASLDLSWAGGGWPGDEWGGGAGELFEDVWGECKGSPKKARGLDDC